MAVVNLSSAGLGELGRGVGPRTMIARPPHGAANIRPNNLGGRRFGGTFQKLLLDWGHVIWHNGRKEGTP